jgi:hypothetical protein
MDLVLRRRRRIVVPVVRSCLVIDSMGLTTKVAEEEDSESGRMRRERMRVSKYSTALAVGPSVIDQCGPGGVCSRLVDDSDTQVCGDNYRYLSREESGKQSVGFGSPRISFSVAVTLQSLITRRSINNALSHGQFMWQEEATSGPVYSQHYQGPPSKSTPSTSQGPKSPESNPPLTRGEFGSYASTGQETNSEWLASDLDAFLNPVFDTNSDDEAVQQV